MAISREIARQACDACRQRRIRCEPSNGPTSAYPCKRCIGATLECTFNMPVKRRGPPAKRRRISFGEASNSNGNGSDEASTVSRAEEIIHSKRPAHHGLNPESSSRMNPSIGNELAINQFCSQVVFDEIMKNYIDIIYPLLPVVHLPTFDSDLRHLRYNSDRDFLCFVLSMCAAVVAILPGKFPGYKQLDRNFTYYSRLDAVENICAILNRLKKPDYYDSPTFEKWATTHLLGRAFIYLGYRKRLNYYHAEAQAFMLDLEFHRIKSYANLNHIEIQLRKKAFWLTAMVYIHLKPENLTWDSLSDRFLFHNSDATELMPLNLDDEFIRKEGLLEQPPNKPALTEGFIALARVNSCLVTIKQDPAFASFMITCHEGHHRDVLGTCSCGKHIRPTPLLSLLQLRLGNTEHVLDEVPAEISLHPESGVESRHDPLRAFQYESMRANVHVTHRWTQSLMVERMISLPDMSSDERIQLWQMQEHICAQLLDFLNTASQAALEPHGLLLPWKIRQVAAALLDCPPEAGALVSQRAGEHIKAFAAILARLDEAHAQN